MPAATRLAVLVNPANAANTETTLRDVEPAARRMGLQIHIVRASKSHEIDAAFATIASERSDALFVCRRSLLQQPACPIVPCRDAPRDPRDLLPGASITEAGGLMSYGSDIADAYRQIGDLYRPYPQGCQAG